MRPYQEPTLIKQSRFSRMDRRDGENDIISLFYATKKSVKSARTKCSWSARTKNHERRSTNKGPRTKVHEQRSTNKGPQSEGPRANSDGGKRNPKQRSTSKFRWAGKESNGIFTISSYSAKRFRCAYFQ